MEYYITLDVGTSSSKIAIIDTECKVIFKAHNLTLHIILL